MAIRFHHETLEGGGFPPGNVQCPAAGRWLHGSGSALQERFFRVSRKTCHVEGPLSAFPWLLSNFLVVYVGC